MPIHTSKAVSLITELPINLKIDTFLEVLAGKTGNNTLLTISKLNSIHLKVPAILFIDF